jgi:alkylation response protein AidB-like acyl-CoA dehydrogenase
MECAPRYHPTRDQLAIAAQITDSFDRILPLSRLHSSWSESDSAWSALRDLGVFSATLSEEQGGSGLGATEEALIAMGLGRQLASPAVVATLQAAHVPGMAVRLEEVSRGRVLAGYRRNGRGVQIEESGASLLLLREPAGVALREFTGAGPSIDARLWLAELRETAAEGATLAQIDGEALLPVRLIDAAVLVGAAERALVMAVSYAGIRQQFGHPIGAFQAIKHHCANMAVSARRARDQVCFASVALDGARGDAALQVECALLAAVTAALENAALNIQIHGGIGFSDEADPHLVLKRAQLYGILAGGTEAASERILAIDPVP